MEGIIRERERARLEAISIAKRFLNCVKKYVEVVDAYLIGSYARGDFNAWSDIDIVIVAKNLPESPIERLDIIDRCMSRYLNVEPILLNPEDFKRLFEKSNPIATEIKKYGVKLI